MNKEKTDIIYNSITSNGCREMDEERFHQAVNELLKLGSVLPTKEEAVSEGYEIANNANYNQRRVLKDLDHDIYYSGWMDCFDWIESRAR